MNEFVCRFVQQALLQALLDAQAPAPYRQLSGGVDRIVQTPRMQTPALRNRAFDQPSGSWREAKKLRVRSARGLAEGYDPLWKKNRLQSVSRYVYYS